MNSGHTHDNSFLRFLSALFAMVGFGAARHLISRKDWLRQNLSLPVFAADGASILSQLFSLRACGNAAAQLHRHLRQSTLRLLSLAQARSSGGLDVSDDNDAFMPPVPWRREACDFLTAQNVAARVPALYDAWDRLEDQAGRFIRWHAQRERECVSDPWRGLGDYPGGGFTARLFVAAKAFAWLAGFALVCLVAACASGKGAAILLRFNLPALPARASPDTS